MAEDTRPLISYKFDTPLNFNGRPIIEACKIYCFNRVTRDGAKVFYELGYVTEDEDGYELSFTPIGNTTEFSIDGDAYLGITGQVVNGTTMEVALITEGYKAIVNDQLARGNDWRGRIRVNATTNILVISTPPSDPETEDPMIP